MLYILRYYYPQKRALKLAIRRYIEFHWYGCSALWNLESSYHILKKHTQYHDICFLANRQVNDSDFRFTTSECKENAITWYIIDIYRFRLFCYATIYDFGFVKLIQILYVSNDTPYTMCSIHVINIVANYKQIFNGKS